MLKNIVKDLKPSSTLRINEISKELENKGKKIFKFGFGQSPFQVPLNIVNELKINAKQNKYSVSVHLSLMRFRPVLSHVQIHFQRHFKF